MLYTYMEHTKFISFFLWYNRMIPLTTWVRRGGVLFTFMAFALKVTIVNNGESLGQVMIANRLLLNIYIQ